MTIKLNWDRVKQLHSDLELNGWKDDDKMTVIIIGKDGKPKKSAIPFKDLYRFCWDISDNTSYDVLTFLIQDVEGKVLYRHRQIVGNEEIPLGGNSDVISHWTALTDDEKETYIKILVAEIDAYER